MSDLRKAIEIAQKAHQGQVDKGGSPYIEHPFRVMNQFTNESEKIVGVIHDVVEDSELTLVDLKKVRFKERIIEAVDVITKAALIRQCVPKGHQNPSGSQGEGSQNYFNRVMNNPIALKVKIADMTDNMDLSRIPNITEKDRARLKKYQINIAKLKKKLSEGKI